MTGSGTGCKSGAAHHRAKYDNQTVELARTLHDRLGSATMTGIAMALCGHAVPADTLSDWIYYRVRTRG